MDVDMDNAWKKGPPKTAKDSANSKKKAQVGAEMEEEGETTLQKFKKLQQVADEKTQNALVKVRNSMAETAKKEMG